MNTIESSIGQAAGKIWDTLNANGSLPKSGLAKATGLPSNLLNQGIGWLAREGKLDTVKEKKTELFVLKE